MESAERYKSLKRENAIEWFANSVWNGILTKLYKQVQTIAL
jgi:hypothetical protein